MSSILGRAGRHRPGGAAYAASKIAVEGLTRELARQWAPHGSASTPWRPATSPPEMNAPMTLRPGRRRRWWPRIPLGRGRRATDIAGGGGLPGQPRAGYVTGRVLPLDGGMSCW